MIIKEDNKGEICKCICNYEIKATIPAKNIGKVQIYGIYYPEAHPYELLGEESNETCVGLGQIGQNPSLGPEDPNRFKICCNGLKEIVPKNCFKPTAEGDCGEMCVGSGVICLACGDENCDANYENKCNCPEDCG